MEKISNKFLKFPFSNYNFKKHNTNIIQIPAILYKKK